jgi:hypothetical protein
MGAQIASAREARAILGLKGAGDTAHAVAAQ